MEQITLAGKPLKYFHTCAFFKNRDEEYALMNPFYKEGIDQNEQLLTIIDPNLEEEHRERLNQAGINTPHCESCGQLSVLPWKQAYLNEDGIFDKSRMLEAVDHMTGKGRETGFNRLRIMGNMDWVFSSPNVDLVLEYEAQVNEVLQRNRQPAVCVYNINNLSGTMMMDILRTHPLVLIGGLVQENPFFTPPEEMVSQLRARARNM